MHTETLQILLVEDNKAHIELIRRAFEGQDTKFNFTVAGTLAEARKILKKASPQLMITDYLLPDGKGSELLPGDIEKCTIPMIILTGHGDEKIAATAIKSGAIDYIVKSDKTLADMPYIIGRILEAWEHITKRRQAEEAFKQKLDEIERMNRLMVGRELKMEELRKEIKRLKEEVALCKERES